MSKWFWYIGHFIASLGCRLNGGHPPHKDEDLTLMYCQHCGKRRRYDALTPPEKGD